MKNLEQVSEGAGLIIYSTVAIGGALLFVYAVYQFANTIAPALLSGAQSF